MQMAIKKARLMYLSQRLKILSKDIKYVFFIVIKTPQQSQNAAVEVFLKNTFYNVAVWRTDILILPKNLKK
jgi:hypothetical protein